MSLVKDELQTAMAAPRARRPGGYAVELVVSAIVVVTLVVTSPGLLQAPLATVFLALWEVIPLVACLVFSDWFLGRMRIGQSHHQVVHHAATILLAGLLTELLELLVDLARSGDTVSLAGWFPELLEGCAYASVFWIVCLAIRAALRRASGEGHSASIPAMHPGPRPPAGLLGMLPEALRDDIRWMKAEGNYIGVYGTKDYQLVNYVFSRAINEMGSVGLQVHRSYWVALDALERVHRQDGRIYVELKGGDRIPVSRSFLSEVAEAVETSLVG